MQTFTFNRYKEFLERVIEWNRVAKGGFFKFSDKDIDLQKTITKEELDETIKAINENDQQETIDGIADVFVTAGFLNYMKSGNKEIPIYNIVPEHEPMGILSRIDHDRLFGVVGPSHHDIQKLYAWACFKFGQDMVDTYFESVLKSNESKFTPSEKWDDKELIVAKNKYMSKGFTGIVAVDGSFNGKPVKILRADKGKGKILKPSSFKEPTDFH